MAINRNFGLRRSGAGRLARASTVFTLTLLGIEFLDELIFGLQGAVMPQLRSDLGLTYAEVGLMLSLPAIVGNLLDPAIGILGDVWRRKVMIVGGGLVITGAMALITAGHSLAGLLAAFVLAFPASTAFVSLSQATLMDSHPGRREQMMARWVVFGSVARVLSPVIVTATFAWGFGWRGLYGWMAVLAGLLTAAVWSQPFNGSQPASQELHFHEGLRNAWHAIRDRALLRWIVLLELSDLLLDVFAGFCALYFRDVVKVSEAGASASIAVLTGAGLVGDLLLVPLLERVRGLSIVRLTSAAVLVVYVVWLVLPVVWIKYTLLALLGLGTAGWYQVLQAQAFSSRPDQSGAVIAAKSLSGTIAGLLPWLLGLIARRFGLPWAMALLALGPVGLIVLLPRRG